MLAMKQNMGTEARALKYRVYTRLFNQKFVEKNSTNTPTGIFYYKHPKCCVHTSATNSVSTYLRLSDISYLLKSRDIHIFHKLHYTWVIP